ncbi:MAG: thiamine diphosphokinase [Clostridioides sp.]|jgi:thiamine pyrophosphokinase|nr:thiamine diphosphokinase [Clostridioides sp.]
MKICIILNGEVDDYEKISSIIKNNHYDYIICADGGANHAYKMDIIPDYIIGDLDSVEEDVKNYYEKFDTNKNEVSKNANNDNFNNNSSNKNTSKEVKFERFPKRKDETDTELCVWLAKDLQADAIDLIGALGGRIDHTLANIRLMSYSLECGMDSKIITSKEEIYILKDGALEIEGNKGTVISILPDGGHAQGISLSGLEYPLSNYTMKYSKVIGISNVMESDVCKIEVKKGQVLIIKNL